MKFKKTLFTLSSLMLLMSLTACNTGENKNNGAKSDPTSSSQTTPSGDSSSLEPLVNPTVLPALNVVLYNKFVDEEQSNTLKNSFNAFLRQSNVEITNLVWDLKVTGNAKTLNDAIQTYNEANPTAKYDVILGGKAWTSECTYLSANYEVMKDGEGNTLEMTIGANADRRVYILPDSPNAAAIKLLIKNTLNYDIPEEDPDADVKPIPNPDTVLPELNVVLYKKFVSDDNSKALKNAFITYLNTNSVGITSLTWDVKIDGNGKALNDAVFEYNEANPSVKYDVILGGKSWTDDCTYLTSAYQVVADGEDVPYEMTIGAKTDRRVYILKTTDNPNAVNELVKHLLGVDLS